MRSSLDKPGHSSMALLSLSVRDRKVMQLTFHRSGASWKGRGHCTTMTKCTILSPHEKRRAWEHNGARCWVSAWHALRWKQPGSFSPCPHSTQVLHTAGYRVRTNCQIKMARPSTMLMTLPGCRDLPLGSHKPPPSGLYLALIEYRKLGWSREGSPSCGHYNFCYVLDNPCPEPPQKPSSPGPVGRLTPSEKRCGIISVYTVTISDWYNKKLNSQ